MDAVEAVFVIAASAAGVAVLAWVVTNRHHPERGCGHHLAGPATRSDQLYGGSDRPAGPEAETTDTDMLGGDQATPVRATRERVHT